MKAQRLKEFVADAIGGCIDLDARVIASTKRYIFCLHRIMTEAEAQTENVHHSMWVSPNTLDRLISWAQVTGRVVSLDEIMDFDKPNEVPLFAITFDDGWLDNYTQAFPILMKHAVPSTIFIVTQAITTGNLFWVDELIAKARHLFETPINRSLMTWITEHINITASMRKPGGNELMNYVIEALKELPEESRKGALTNLYDIFEIDPEPIKGKLMDWNQVEDMSKAGVSFQSHTHTHRILVNVDDDTMLHELSESKRVIEEMLGKECDQFCYPNARFQANQAFLVGKAGYRFGFKIDNEPLASNVNPFLIPRMLVCENYARNLNYLKLKLLGLPIYNRR